MKYIDFFSLLHKRRIEESLVVENSIVGFLRAPYPNLFQCSRANYNPNLINFGMWAYFARIWSRSFYFFDNLNFGGR